jgi:hypothetical protein
MYPPDWFADNQDSILRAEQLLLADFTANEIISRIDAICRFDVAARLGEIKTPTLVTCAQDDRVTPLHLSHAIAERGAAFKDGDISLGRACLPDAECRHVCRDGVALLVLKCGDRSVGLLSGALFGCRRERLAGDPALEIGKRAA